MSLCGFCGFFVDLYGLYGDLVLFFLNDQTIGDADGVYGALYGICMNLYVSISI